MPGKRQARKLTEAAERSGPSFSDVHGSSAQVEMGWRNGRLTPFFHTDWTQPKFIGVSPEETPDIAIPDEVFRNLTPLETQTWLDILDGRPIADIARDQGVSRAAIYIRIRGKDGKGGMAGKNPWVAAWWKLHQQK